MFFVEDKFKKPERWALDRGLIDHDWDWFWQKAIAAFPLWERGGGVWDQSQYRVQAPLYSTPATWEATRVGHGLRMDANREAAQLTSPDHIRVGFPVTIFTGYISNGIPPANGTIFGVTHNSWDGAPYVAYSFSHSSGKQLNGVINNAGTLLNLNFNIARNAAGVHDNICIVFKSGDSKFFRNGALLSTKANTFSDPTYNAASLLTFGDGVFQNRHPLCTVTYGYILKGECTPQQVRQVANNPSGPFRMRRAADFGFVSAAGVTLSPLDASQPHSADATSFTQIHDLITAEALHAHSADATTLTQTQILAIADALHAHTADATTLSQIHVLLTNEALHGHTADASSFTQVHVLVSADALHSHTADNITMALSGILTVADASHAHTVDAATFSQIHVLAALEALQGHTSDAASFTQNHIFVTADALHGHTADATALLLTTILAADDTTHVHIVDATAFSQVHDLLVADAAQAHTVDATSFTQAQILALADALHAHTADNTILTQPGVTTGAGRIIEVKAQDRTIIVAAQNRTI